MSRSTLTTRRVPALAGLPESHPTGGPPRASGISVDKALRRQKLPARALALFTTTCIGAIPGWRHRKDRRKHADPMRVP